VFEWYFYLMESCSHLHGMLQHILVAENFALAKKLSVNTQKEFEIEYEEKTGLHLDLIWTIVATQTVTKMILIWTKRNTTS
jgi:hypothetical protein